MDLKQRAKQLKADLPALFLALSKKETPLLAKLLAAFAVGYALSPIDLVPDFIPVLGQLDDLLLLPILVTLSIRMIPPEVLAGCRVEAEGLWQKGKPKRWLFALPILLCWLLLAFWLIRMLL